MQAYLVNTRAHLAPRDSAYSLVPAIVRTRDHSRHQGISLKHAPTIRLKIYNSGDGVLIKEIVVCDKCCHLVVICRTVLYCTGLYFGDRVFENTKANSVDSSIIYIKLTAGG